MRSVTATSGSNLSSIEIYDNASTHNQSTAYDGFSIILESGLLMGGAITVYGFNQ